MKKVFFIPLLFLVAFTGFSQQSPEEKLSQPCGATNVDIVYCRPSVRGRAIFGELVPYGEVWRTGANAATTIEFKTDVKFGGKPVKAGKYALFTIPGKTDWEIILNSAVKSWGSFKYKKEEDVLRVTVKPDAQPGKTEMFTIRFVNNSKTACDMELLWDNISVKVPVTN